MLYAAFDDGGDTGLAGDLASPNGKVLRLNADGSTPRDQAGPVYSYAYHSPRGLDWDPASGALWVADREHRRFGAFRAPWFLSRDHALEDFEAWCAGTYALPHTTTPSSIAFYRGSIVSGVCGKPSWWRQTRGGTCCGLLVGNRFESGPGATEGLLQDRVGRRVRGRDAARTARFISPRLTLSDGSCRIVLRDARPTVRDRERPVLFCARLDIQ